MACCFSLLAAYGYGYYRGTLECSFNSTIFALSMNEGIYHEIEQNNPDYAKGVLKTVINGESRSLRALQKSPFSYFEYQVKIDNDGDISKELQKADLITQSANLTPQTSKPGK